jgi:dTDP-4-amino-4,6-dideoxygalactose transaminase
MEYKIPLFDLNFGNDVIEEVVKTIQSNWISTGPKCQEFEEIFADMLNVKYAITLANCTCALHLANIVLDIKQGDEVICPSLTFAASVNSIRYVGANPVFCDVKSAEHINMDSNQIEKLITSKTKAILVVHMAGFPADMDEIMAIAKKHNLKVIEDACHAPLSEYKGRKLGTIGDVGCFSFFSNKNISTGEGGMIVTNNEDLAKRMRLLRSHGMTTMSYQRAKGHATSYDIVDLGFNYRMDDIRATIGITQMRHLKEDLEKRAIVRTFYINALKNEKKITIPFEKNTEYVSNYIMPIVLNDSTSDKRDKVREYLNSKGIQTSVHYPAIHNFSIYSQFKSELPNTDYICANEITLPMYSKLSQSDITFICDTLKEAIL